MKKIMEVDLGGFLTHNSTYDYDMNYEYNEDYEPKRIESVLIIVVYSVVLAVGLLGNALLLVVLFQKRRYWRISDTFILHLGVADILLLVTLPFWAVQEGQQSGWCFGTVFCKICGAVFNINFYCGIFLLVCISLDQYLSIVHSVQLYSLTNRTLARTICLSVWPISLLLTIPDWIFLVAQKDSAQERTQCVYKYSVSDFQLWPRLLHHIVGLLLPAAALIISCSSMLLWLKHSSKDLRKQKAVMVILLLVAAFFLCWMPYNITLIVDTYKHSKHPRKVLSEGSLKTALKVTSALGCVHACLRPLLYFILCGNFRKQTLAILRCVTVESKSSLWELGDEALPKQSHEADELQQMTSVDPRVPSSQC